MFQRLGKCVAGVLAASLLVGVAVAASEAPYKEKGVGLVTNLAPGHIEFAGVGTATHVGKYTEVGGNDFDDQGHISNGAFVITAKDGSTLSGTYFGTYAPLATGELQFTLNATYQVGTGRFAGVTGQADIVAVLPTLAPGATFQYQGLGSLLLP